MCGYFLLKLMKIKEINHVALYVRDLPQTVHFYGNVLELPILPRPNFDFEGAWFALGTTHTLHIIAGRTSEEITGGSRKNHFAVEVESIKDCEEFLRNKGLSFLGPKRRPDGAPQIFLQDPEGYWIEFTSDEFMTT